MAWESAGDRESIHIDILAKDKPNLKASLQREGAVNDQGFTWVETQVDRNTGVTRRVAWVGEPEHGGRPVLVDQIFSRNSSGGIELPEQSDSIKTLREFSTLTLDLIKKGFLTSAQGIDLVHSLHEKISGKSRETRMTSGTSIINNLLALAPKVHPDNAEIFSKGIVAAMGSMGLFGSPASTGNPFLDGAGVRQPTSDPVAFAQGIPGTSPESGGDSRSVTGRALTGAREVLRLPGRAVGAIGGAIGEELGNIRADLQGQAEEQSSVQSAVAAPFSGGRENEPLDVTSGPVGGSVSQGGLGDGPVFQQVGNIIKRVLGIESS